MRTKGKFKVLAASLAAVGMLASCSVNDDINEGTGDGQVRFTAGIGEIATPLNTPGSRAAGTEWDGTDKVGIFMVQGGTPLAENKQYNVSNVLTGAFTPETGNEIYYPMDGSIVHFIAYYPYESSAVLSTPIDVTIGNQNNQAAFDLLYSNNARGSKSNGTTPVALTFDHKLSKIVMNCKGDATVGTLPINMTVSIKGMNTKNTFDLSTGSLGTANTAVAITPRKIATAATFDASYDAIIMPGNYGDGVVTVEFTIPGTPDETFTWTLEAVKASFTGGNEYTYAVTLSRTGVTATGEINPWITGGSNDSGPVTAE